MKKILLTGAAGRIGSVLREGLSDLDCHLRLSDQRPIETQPNEDFVKADLSDPKQVAPLLAGMDCVVHLAGFPNEANFGKILRDNLVTSYNIFEAARKQRVSRVIFASSNRVTSFYESQTKVSTDMPLRPDGLYSVSKGFGELLGRLYSDKYGLSVACLRIGSFYQKPMEKRHLKTWISHKDMIHLIKCCIEAPSYDHITLYGVSNNTRNQWVSPDAEKIGYQPQDNAEDFADALSDRSEEKFQGGKFCSSP